jgi:uncharacterized membrane protein
MRHEPLDSDPGWRSPGLLLGVGLGGFADGIVLHQILQWHNMLSAVQPPTTLSAMHLNMRWDGFFHALTWLLTMAGVLQLWRAGIVGAIPRPARAFAGQLLLGWGAFNLIEGLVDHQLLGIHHVREGPGWLAYDLAFLGVGGIGLLLVGLMLARRDRTRASAPAPDSRIT